MHLRQSKTKNLHYAISKVSGNSQSTQRQTDYICRRYTLTPLFTSHANIARARFPASWEKKVFIQSRFCYQGFLTESCSTSNCTVIHERKTRDFSNAIDIQLLNSKNDTNTQICTHTHTHKHTHTHTDKYKHTHKHKHKHT